MTTTAHDPDSLDAALDGDWRMPEGNAAHLDAYAIPDAAVFATVMRRYRAVQAKRAAIQAQAQPQLDAIEAWATRKDRPLRDDADRLEAWLRDYALTARTRDPRVKSVSCPWGDVATRETLGGWEIADAVAVLAWARKSAPGLVKTIPASEAFVLADAKRQLKAADDGTVFDPRSGEAVPGIKALPSTTTAKVTFAAAAGEPGPDLGTPVDLIQDT